MKALKQQISDRTLTPSNVFKELTEILDDGNDGDTIVCCDTCNGFILRKFTTKRLRVNYVGDKEARVEVYVCRKHIPLLESGDTIGGDY